MLCFWPVTVLRCGAQSTRPRQPTGEPPMALASPTDPSCDLLGMTQAAAGAAESLLADAVLAVRSRVIRNGELSGRMIDREQRAAHGLAWLATYVEAVRQLASYAERIDRAGRLGEVEELLVRIGVGEYLAQMAGGIAMSQGEVVRPSDLGLSATQVAARIAPVEAAIASGNTAANRARLIELMRAQT